MTDLMNDTAIVTLSLFEPRAWQQAAGELIAEKRFVVIPAARRSGKTELAVFILLGLALSIPNGNLVYIAPTAKQAAQVSWPVFRRQLEQISGVEFRESDKTIQFPNGSKISLESGEQADRLRGQGFHFAIIDEVAQIDAEKWRNAIRPTLSDKKLPNGRPAGGIFIGTPGGGHDLFRELYQYATSGIDPDWGAMKVDAYEAGGLTREEIAAAERELGPNAFAREYMVDFDADREDALVTHTHVRAARDRTSPRRMATERRLRGTARVMGVDPGGNGADGDCSAIVIRVGDVVLPVKRVPSERNDELVQIVANLAYENDVDAILCDATGGWSQGLIPGLQSAGFNPIPVNFSSVALNQQLYSNRRSEMWHFMAKWLSTPLAILPADEMRLANELLSVRYNFNGRGQVSLEAKSDVRKRLGGQASPDSADALALTFAMPVNPRTDQMNRPFQGVRAPRRADGSKYQSDYSDFRRDSWGGEHDVFGEGGYDPYA